ncbi:MAG: YihY/virulence factor BrkB family protein [Rhodobacter sp.]|nr:YihY/virulence factor BrkB family protein [Rhodobacter sp.]MCA3493020.1 YihY/virulence factor BrkB family protein [Rhodobacter sp.]MCA3500342.1 YihY/virulence factor BrkB family protein [Rhodobacter sp.]MCA3505184.1 YihY/virulence factor BrkB family protein [Rhodobacter sp.]MCA3516010.1 YihY/virulence factor BrkB family protein [Rhodobacter sp.]
MFSLSNPVIHTANLLWHRSFDAKLGLISAGVAFFGFLAIFPAAAAVIALWGFASDPEVIRGQIALLQDFLPADAFKVLDTQVQALISSNGDAFGATTILSTLFALWSARAGVDALIQGLDAAYGTSPRGGMWHAVQAVFLTATLIAVALVSVLAAVVVPLLLAVLPMGPDSARLFEIVNEILGLSVVIFGVALAYRFGPNHPSRTRPRILPGLILSTLLWAAASRAFMLYLANFGSYNQIYGSIGAVVVLLMWFWFSSYAVLLGAALNAVMPRRAQ